MTAPLHTRAWPGDGFGGPTIVLLHGFTQNTDCWGLFADELAADHRVLAVDAPGHGRSGHDDADLWRAADLIAATVEPHAPVVVVGYSMGGRMALHLALAHPTIVAGLVLIGATAGIDDDAERAVRRAADEQLANRIESEPLDDFIDSWLANPLFAGLDADAACRNRRLQNRPAGLAASLRRCGTGSQTPLWNRLPELAGPVLLIAGSRDSKFSALAERMAAAMTSAAVTVASVEATHAVHLEQPARTVAVIDEWLADRFGS